MRVDRYVDFHEARTRFQTELCRFLVRCGVVGLCGLAVWVLEEEAPYLRIGYVDIVGSYYGVVGCGGRGCCVCRGGCGCGCGCRSRCISYSSYVTLLALDSCRLSVRGFMFLFSLIYLYFFLILLVLMHYEGIGIDLHVMVLRGEVVRKRW